MNHKMFELIDYQLILKETYVVFDLKMGLKKMFADGKL